jgi:putative spermidine/putrescine transport system ATP-binding protein
MAFLELLDIQKKFATFTAVQSFNLNVERGEFISFLGPSGCGKTTTLRMIAGFEHPTSGVIRIANEDVTHKPPQKRNTGMVFQAYALFPNMTVAANIGFGLKIAGKSSDEIKRRVDEMLALIHLQEFGHRYPYQMSGGQQQRVALARAIAIRPQVLLLDEPLSALDAKIRVELRQEIRTIQRTLGITTIYVTHDQEEALSLSDRIVVMNRGQVEQIGTPFEIYNFPTTSFVASFVGTLNVLKAEVLDAFTGQVSIDGQKIVLAQPLTKTLRAPLSIALRPESITLNSHATDANQLHGQIETITFLGSIVRVQLRLAQNKLFFDTFNNPHLSLPKVGETVTVNFPREACLVVEGDTTAVHA